MTQWTYILVKTKTKQHKRQTTMHFNGLFEKSPTKSSFKWSVLIMNKGECKHSTGKILGKFIVFELHKRLEKRFNPEPFAGDTSLFCTVQDIITSIFRINYNHLKVSECEV